MHYFEALTITQGFRQILIQQDRDKSSRLHSTSSAYCKRLQAFPMFHLCHQIVPRTSPRTVQVSSLDTSSACAVFRPSIALFAELLQC